MPPKKPRKLQSRVSGPEHLRNVRYGRRYRQNRARLLGQSRACALKLEGCTGFADQVDHVVEVDRGGASTLENLQASCRNCNQRKKNRRVGWSGKGVPSASDLDGYTGGCARSQGGPHNLSEFGGPSECYGQPGHASQDW